MDASSETLSALAEVHAIEHQRIAEEAERVAQRQRDEVLRAERERAAREHAERVAEAEARLHLELVERRAAELEAEGARLRAELDAVGASLRADLEAARRSRRPEPLDAISRPAVVGPPQEPPQARRTVLGMLGAALLATGAAIGFAGGHAAVPDRASLPASVARADVQTMSVTGTTAPLLAAAQSPHAASVPAAPAVATPRPARAAAQRARRVPRSSRPVTVAPARPRAERDELDVVAEDQTRDPLAGISDTP